MKILSKNIKIFAINLERNDYRRQHILNQQEKAGIAISIFNAITPATIHTVNHCYDEQKARNFTGRPMMSTELACGLSHISLWRQLMADKEADYYVIFEDDVHIIGNIDQILSNMDLTDINFLKFSGQVPRPMKVVRNLDENYGLYRYAYGPLDAAAYLVSKQAAGILVNYCITLHTPIDILMDRSYDHGIAIHGIHPYPVKTAFCFDKGDPLCSDIGERAMKYAPDITIFEKSAVRFQRVIGSIKRKYAAIQLFLEKKSGLME